MHHRIRTVEDQTVGCNDASPTSLAAWGTFDLDECIAFRGHLRMYNIILTGGAGIGFVPIDIGFSGAEPTSEHPRDLSQDGEMAVDGYGFKGFTGNDGAHYSLSKELYKTQYGCSGSKAKFYHFANVFYGT